MKQTPDPELFVVYVKRNDKGEVSHRLATVGAIEELDENSLLLRTKAHASSPAAQWRELAELAGSLATVQPVLIDEQGQTLFPTGDLTVRFPRKLTNRQLKDFAEKYELQLRDRNEFVPEQAAFQLKNPTTTYLPDVLQRIATDKDIQSSWPNTRSRYQRLT